MERINRRQALKLAIAIPAIPGVILGTVKLVEAAVPAPAKPTMADIESGDRKPVDLSKLSSDVSTNYWRAYRVSEGAGIGYIPIDGLEYRTQRQYSYLYVAGQRSEIILSEYYLENGQKATKLLFEKKTRWLAGDKSGIDWDYDPFVVLPNHIVRIDHYVDGRAADNFPAKRRVSNYLSLNPFTKDNSTYFEIVEKRPAPIRY